MLERARLDFCMWWGGFTLIGVGLRNQRLDASRQKIARRGARGHHARCCGRCASAGRSKAALKSMVLWSALCAKLSPDSRVAARASSAIATPNPRLWIVLCVCHAAVLSYEWVVSAMPGVRMSF